MSEETVKAREGFVKLLAPLELNVPKSPRYAHTPSGVIIKLADLDDNVLGIYCNCLVEAFWDDIRQQRKLKMGGS